MPNHGRLIVSLSGTTLQACERDIITHPMTAGIILFTRNYAANDLKGLASFIADIQNIAIESGKKEGLPIFVDQEGGYVQRLRLGFTALPTPEVFGVAYDIEPQSGIKLAHTYGKKMAQELNPFGIINLAPVLDLKAGNKVIEGLNRAFHANPQVCSQLAQAYIEGMAEGGMKATAKHFPGHGHDVGDSHLVQPKDDRSLAELESSDLVPFISLIKKNKLAAIMPSHIIYEQVDAQKTAGMSQIWLQTLLREKYGFDGLIVSDCLSMKGAGLGNHLDKTKAALEFGDIALLCNVEAKEILEVLNGLDKSYKLSSQAQKRWDHWVSPTLGARLSLAKTHPQEAVTLEASPSILPAKTMQDKRASNTALKQTTPPTSQNDTVSLKHK